MSTINPSQESGQTLACRQEQQVHRPDFGFWHQVFDQAHGSAVDSRMSHDPGRNIRQAPMPWQSSKSGHPGFDGSRVRQEPGALLGEVQHPQTPCPSELGAEPGISDSRTAPPCLFTPQRSAASAEEMSRGVAEHARSESLRLREPSRSEEVILKAHLMQTEEGRLKVALRAPRSLSPQQALVALGQALTQDGGAAADLVEQVVMNGKPIYQAASGQSSESPGTHLFDLKC